MSHALELVVGGDTVTLTRQDRDEGHFEVLVEGHATHRTVPGRLLQASLGWVTLRLDGATHRVRLLRHDGALWASVAGESYRLAPPDRRRGHGGGAGTGRVESPMPGTVLEVLVREGEAVTEGQDLLVVEAMKMEHRLRAGSDGVVRGLSVKAGDRVEAGVEILEVVAADAEPG